MENDAGGIRIATSQGFPLQICQKKVKSVFEPGGLNSRSLSHFPKNKVSGSIATPPCRRCWSINRLPSPSVASSSPDNSPVPIYTPGCGERGTGNVKCFSQEHNTLSRPVSIPDLSTRTPADQPLGHRAFNSTNVRDKKKLDSIKITFNTSATNSKIKA